MVVVGVLVGFAIPRFRSYKRKAHVAAMVSDLRSLAAAEEEYWRVVKSYTSNSAALSFARSPRVTLRLVSADAMGWSARATYSTDSSAVCAIYYGAAPALPPATTGNVIGCTK